MLLIYLIRSVVGYIVLKTEDISHDQEALRMASGWDFQLHTPLKPGQEDDSDRRWKEAKLARKRRMRAAAKEDRERAKKNANPQAPTGPLPTVGFSTDQQYKRFPFNYLNRPQFNPYSQFARLPYMSSPVPFYPYRAIPINYYNPMPFNVQFNPYL